jgi:hypothetical protein
MSIDKSQWNKSTEEQVISTIENNFPGLRVAERVRHKTSRIVLFLYPDEREVNTNKPLP